jgi:hypothetical protein
MEVLWDRTSFGQTVDLIVYAYETQVNNSVELNENIP